MSSTPLPGQTNLACKESKEKTWDPHNDISKVLYRVPWLNFKLVIGLPSTREKPSLRMYPHNEPPIVSQASKHWGASPT